MEEKIERILLAIYTQGIAISSILLLLNSDNQLFQLFLFYVIYISEIPLFNFLGEYLGKRKKSYQKSSNG